MSQVAANRIELPKDKELAKQVAEGHQKLSELDAHKGFLGQIWGTADSAPVNIVGLVAILLIIVGIVISFILGKDSMKEFLTLWSTIFGLIGTIIGYLFGKQSR